MDKVRICFNNVQSHENTTFTLCPGVNFILAEDNNVGKSTIFRMLTAVAKAPAVSAQKLDRLVRRGCYQASALFEFGNETVLAWIQKSEGAATKMFFEHTTPDGVTTRTVFCPRSLLKALGIVVTADGDVVNFNDADSVQLIAKSSNEADTILTHVMLDADVERIKDNMRILSKDIVVDYKMISSKLETAEQLSADLEYRPEVEDFFKEVDLLQTVCHLADTAPVLSEPVSVPVSKELECIGRYLEIADALSGFIDKAGSKISEEVDINTLSAAIDKLMTMSGVSLKSIASSIMSEEELDNVETLIRLQSKIYGCQRSCSELQFLETKLKSTVFEQQQVYTELSKNSAKVVCPVKGEVLYTDEKCIPRID